MKRIEGLAVAFITPFKENGKIDQTALQKHIEYLHDTGVPNLYILGTTAEFLLLDIEERKFIAELVLAQASSEMNVFVQVGDMKLEKACELAEHAEKKGAAGIGAISPYYFNARKAEYFNYYQTIASSVSEDFAVYLYNLPACSTNDMLLEDVQELAEIKNIAGIKNSMNDMNRIFDLIDLTPDDFDVIQGEDTLLMPALIYGAQGNVSGVANVFPEEYLKMYNYLEQKDLVKLQQSQRKIKNIIRAMQGLPSLAYLKDTLALRGFKQTYLRSPLQGITSEERSLLEKNIGQIAAEYPSLDKYR